MPCEGWYSFKVDLILSVHDFLDRHGFPCFNKLFNSMFWWIRNICHWCKSRIINWVKKLMIVRWAWVLTLSEREIFLSSSFKKSERAQKKRIALSFFFLLFSAKKRGICSFPKERLPNPALNSQMWYHRLSSFSQCSFFISMTLKYIKKIRNSLLGSVLVDHDFLIQLTFKGTVARIFVI